MNLVPVPSEPQPATCTSCGAELVADQRYCLSCGQPCSPVRLAFLDVLQGEPTRAAGTAAVPGWIGAGTAIEIGPGGYATVPVQGGANGWLRRNSGVLGLLAVLLLCLIVGLLLGHWVTQGKSSSGPQIVKIEGLTLPAAAAGAAGASTAASPTPASTHGSSSAKSSAKEEAEESAEAAKETKAEKAPPPAPVKVAPTQLKKLSTSTGKKHEEEVNALGAQPIETG